MLAFNRWVSLVSGVFVMMTAGTLYLFAVYSDSLKTELHVNTSEINSVGTMANAGVWAGMVGGIFLDYFGSRLTMIGGSIMMCGGYFCMYLAAKGSISQSVGLVGVFAFVMGQGSSWVYSACIKVNANNFRVSDRGKVIGSLVCFFGLCGGIFTQIYKGFFANKMGVNAFLLFMSIVLPVVGCTFGMLVNETKGVPSSVARDQREFFRVKLLYFYGLLLAVYILVTSLVLNFTSADPYGWAVVMLLFLSTLVLLPYGSAPYWYWLSDEDEDKNEASQNATFLTTSNNGHSEAARTEKTDGTEKKTYRNGEQGQEQERSDLDETALEQVALLPDMSVLEALKCSDFWLMFLVFLLTIGSGIVAVNNMAELVISLERTDTPACIRSVSTPSPLLEGNQPLCIYASTEDLPHTKDKNTLVSLFSVFNTLGRMGSGLGMDVTAARYNIDRLTWLGACIVIMLVSQLLFIISSLSVLYAAVPILGIAYGGFFCVVPTLTSTLFGMSNYGTILGVMTTAPAVGSALMATLLAGKLDDLEQQRGEVLVGGAGHCSGVNCYRFTFMITSGCCVLAMLVFAKLRKQTQGKRAMRETAQRLLESQRDQ